MKKNILIFMLAAMVIYVCAILAAMSFVGGNLMIFGFTATGVYILLESVFIIYYTKMRYKQQVAILTIAATLDYLCNAPFDYSNGVVYNGLDEGNVRGREAHNELIDDLINSLEILS